MQADERFLGLDKAFWANVRTISEKHGYTERGKGVIKVPSQADVKRVLKSLNLTHDHITDGTFLTDFGRTLFDYFQYRADVLNKQVEGLLMDADEAGTLFNDLHQRLQPKCPLPMNKQKGDKKQHAFLTGMVNMLVEANVGAHPCDYDPRELTTVTRKRLFG